MTGQHQESEPDPGLDPWEEFDGLGPAAPDRVPGQPGGEPHGFGFRTGVRSRSVALGFAIYTLALGTALILTGFIFFTAMGQWWLAGLMILIEATFVFFFTRLARQARRRRRS